MQPMRVRLECEVKVTIIIYAEGALSSVVQQFIVTLRFTNMMLLTLISNFNDRHHPTVIIIFDSLISAEAMI